MRSIASGALWAGGKTGRYRDLVDAKPLGADDLSPALETFTHVNSGVQVRWHLDGDEAREDALWNFLFGLVESDDTIGIDAGSKTA